MVESAWLDTRILVAGHSGLVGTALVQRLRGEGCRNLLLPPHRQLDLRDPHAVDEYIGRHKPELVFLVAGTVGGILANATRPAEFLYDNLMIHASVIHSSRKHAVRKLLYLGSSCIYPRDCPQPMREEHLLTGPLEPTNEGYAIAKIAGIRMCQYYRRQYGCDFISAMPTNIYGPHDNFDLENAHVVPALLRKFHEARLRSAPRVTVWGSGTPRREFLHADDLADACVFLMRSYSGESHVNIGTGEDISILELADVIRGIVCPEITVEFDASKPDGMPRKLLDVGRLNALGWRARIRLPEGLQTTYRWFADNYEMAISRKRAHAPVA
jgi:GDP-L-fucose synthase